MLLRNLVRGLALASFCFFSACGGGNGSTGTLSTTFNNAPVANAGIPQSVLAGSLVTLNGSTSSDANGDALTYSWSLTAKPTGSSAALSSATSAISTFTADIAGTFVASLIVNDGKLNSNTATVSVTAARANAAPVANAGTTQSVIPGALVTLNGSASSDANGDVLTYNWSLTAKPTGSFAALSSTTSVQPTFTADSAGTYVASLVVNDGQLNSNISTVSVIAARANAALVANAGPDQLAYAGETVNLSGAASSDANAEPLTYFWTLISKPAGSSANLSTPTKVSSSFIADLVGSYIVELTVINGKSSSAKSTVNIEAIRAGTPGLG